MNKKLVILSCYGDGCIENKVFSSLEEAQNDMLRMYVLFATGMPLEKSAFNGCSLAECVDADDLNDDENGTKWLSESAAYYYCEKSMHEYAWNIQEFDLEEMSGLKQNTRLGDLMAKKVCDKTYPGIEVVLNRQNVSLRIALVEVDQSEKDPVLKAHVYSADERIDEPIFDYYSAPAGIISRQPSRIEEDAL